VPGSTSYETITSKRGRLGNKKNPQKIKIKILIFFFLFIIFFSKWEALIHSIWISDVKVMELFVLQAVIATS